MQERPKNPGIIADLLIDMLEEASKPCGPLTKNEEPLRNAISDYSKKNPLTPEQENKLKTIYNNTGWDGGFDF
jgi:hypothetical protein